jgi:4'-phosphopantetheinyl transferase EntD
VIETLMPSYVVTVATAAEIVETDLFPEEVRSLGSAPTKRRTSEFVTGRACARAALELLGFPAQPVPSGCLGEPQWPRNVVGSITHCTGYRACAVARTANVRALGIDAEVHRPLPAGVLESVAGPRERRALGGPGAGIHWDCVLFSAKEAAYKACFPLTALRWDFEDTRVWIGPQPGAFEVDLPDAGSRACGSGTLRGRWLVAGGIVATAVVLAT